MLAQSYLTTGIVACRRAVVPPCDPTVAASGTIPPSVDGQIGLIKVGDIIDFGLDWSAWIEGNGGKIKTSVWAAHALSPQAPVLTSTTLIDEAKKHTLCVIDATAAVVGNIFYIENTVVIEGIANGTFTMPDRTLKRVLHVKVTL